MCKLLHKGVMRLHVFIPTNQEHTRLHSFNQLISVFRQLIGLLLIGWNKNLQAHRLLWDSLDMPVEVNVN